MRFDREGVPEPREGTANELRAFLLNRNFSGARDAEKLIGNWLAAVGTCLGRLQGHRIEKLKLKIPLAPTWMPDASIDLR